MKLTFTRFLPMMLLLASFITLPSFGEEEDAAPRHQATCTLTSKVRNGVRIHGVSVFYAQAVLGSHSTNIAYSPRFRQTRWFETDKDECTFTLNTCEQLIHAYACTLGPEKRHHGKAQIVTTSRPWVLVGPSGVIDSYEDGPFAWNASGLEYCMEDLVSRIFERL